MNFGELQSLTSYWLDDLNFGYFTQTQVQTFLNNAQKEVQKRLIKAGQNYYNKCVGTTLVINQSEYVLPTDFFKLNRLDLILSGTAPNEVVQPLIFSTTNQQDLMLRAPAQPQIYRFKKNRIVIQPYPSQALFMRMEYTYLVQDMSVSTDNPDVPDQFHELIALLAAQDGFIKDGRTAELLTKKIAEYEKDFDEMAQERNQDQPRQVIQTQSYDNGLFW